MDYGVLVNDAFKQYNNVLALSRSPLAATDLVAPALVFDDVTPTAEERGRGLRTVLRWAVEQLAPAPPRFPIGQFRPLDDPTWRDPLWWGYNILRHRYVEPLHPDDFVEGGRYTETLLALTGISSADLFFGERNRAVRTVAEILARQQSSRAADAEVRRLAVGEACAPLAGQRQARALLGIAAIFDAVFARELLEKMAVAEGIADARPALGWLVEHRYLLAGDDNRQLWLGPALREQVRGEQPPGTLRLRHERAGASLARQGNPLAAAYHFQRAEHWAAAADQLLRPAARHGEWIPADLRPLLDAFPAGEPDPPRRRRLNLLRIDVYVALGDVDAAIAAARAGLADAPPPAQRAEFHRRLGKLYEKRNPLHALNYYDQAAAGLADDDPALPVLLKDRGWLHILQRDWARAAADLTRGLALTRADQPALRADLLDALASLHRNQKQYAAAIDDARQALALREASGDLLAVAKSLGNLGLHYTGAGAYADAVAAHREAMNTYRRLGNKEMMATAWLNIGMAQHLAGDRSAALAAYQACLALSRAINLPLAEVKALYNLAEAGAELEQFDAAGGYWQQGMEAAQRNQLDDQVRYFTELAATYPQLGAAPPDAAASSPGPTLSMPAPAAAMLSPDEERIVALARQYGQLTPRLLMDELDVSKPTATRRLRELTEKGLLTVYGKGRATSYAPAAPAQAGSPVLQARLAELGERLAAEYGLAALSVATVTPDAADLAARFQRLPDLETFFRLERRLAEGLGCTVHLKPESVLAEGERGALQVVWVRVAKTMEGT